MFVPSFHFSSLIWVHVMMNAGWGGKALMSSAPPGRSRGYPWPVGMHNPSNVFRVPSQLDLPRSTSAGRQPGGSDDPDIWVFSTWKSRGLEATHCYPKGRFQTIPFLAAWTCQPKTFWLHSKLPQEAQLYMDKGSFILLNKVRKQPLRPWLFHL